MDTEYEPVPMEEPQRRGVLAVLHWALLNTRDNAVSAGEDGISTADVSNTFKSIEVLMDTLHNLPEYLENARFWNEEKFKSELAYYDQEFSGFKVGGGYVKIYETAMGRTTS